MGRNALIARDEEVARVVIEAYRTPFTIASNFARANKEAVTRAASRGLITVFRPQFHPRIDDDRPFGLIESLAAEIDTVSDHTWRVTPKGLAAILDTGDSN
jgi:hypothetical protein